MYLNTLLLVFSAIITASQAVAPVFRADAADKVQAGFKKSTRGGKTRTDLTKIEVNWQPFLMVEDKVTVDKKGLKLGVKVGDSEWNIVDQKPTKRGGGKYRLVLDDVLPCIDHYIRFYITSPDGEEATFDYPNPIAAATAEEIAESGDFTPAVPSNLNVVTGVTQVEISWDSVACASSYEVTYKKLSDDSDSYISEVTAENSIVLTEGIDSCSEFEVIVSSMSGDGYSEGAPVEFSTPPAPEAAKKLEPKITTGINSVQISWEAWDMLSCVDSYSVKICKDDGDCGESVNLQRDDSLAEITFSTSQDLDQCSPYNFYIQPIYPGQELLEIEFPFETLSPPITGILEKLKPVKATPGDEQMTTITWSEVECASGYEVFQHVSTINGDWETIGKSDTNELSIKGVPCTEYRYGVKVTIGGMESEIIEAAEPVITHLPSHEPYVASNLITTPSSDGVEISWDHALCITNYKVKICPKDSLDCLIEEIVMEDSNQHNVTKTIEGLTPCSEYALQIFATSNEEELDAEPQHFSTLAPPATAPENLTASKNSDTNQIDISFNTVECATSYKVYQKLGEGDVEMVEETTNLQTVLPMPESCVKYSISVTSIVDGTESEPTALIEDVVFPDTSERTQPKLTIDERFNNTVVFTMKNPPSNQNCQVETYNIKYKNLGIMEEEELLINASDVEDGKLTLDDFPGASEKGILIEGRIKYTGFEAWSPWISTADRVAADRLNGNGSTSIIVPVVVGIIVAIAVLVIVIFFIMKRRNSQGKYEGEKKCDSEESKKLKENPEV